MTDILKVKVNNQWVGIPAIQGPKGEKGDKGDVGPQGIQGATGPQGVQGIQGPNGEGVPAGGTSGQVLTKASSTDYDTVWLDSTGGGGSIIPIGTCSTAGATAEKAVTLSGFVLETGATIQVTFTNTNTAGGPTLNVNSLGAIAIHSEDGVPCSTANPFYVLAGVTVELTYNGTYWVYKNRVVNSYLNVKSWCRIWSNGFIEQGGISSSMASGATSTVTFLKSFKDTNYTVSVPCMAVVDYGTICCGTKTASNMVLTNKCNGTTTSHWLAFGY